MLTIGTKIHHFTIVAESQPRHGHAHYLCHCDCGNEKVVQGSKLKAGRWKSCGCVGGVHKAGRTRHPELQPQQVVGSLVLVCRTPDKGPATWLCVCECGEMVSVRASSLNDGVTESCGCVRTAGGWGRMRGLWRNMIDRCHNESNPQWDYYGGRGIRVCEAWRASLRQFLADVGVRPSGLHSLDRINNNGHYEPGNVRWATAAEQARNKRNTHLITAAGRTQCVADWATDLDCDPMVIHQRLRAGWSAERAVTLPHVPHQSSLSPGGNAGQQTVIEANGESLSLIEWSRRLGCSPAAIIARIKRGWSHELAVTRPIHVWGVGRLTARAA